MQKGDFEALEAEGIDAWAGDSLDDIEAWEGHAFTAVSDGVPIGISGFALKADGTGLGWLVGSRELRKRPMFLHRTMKRVLGEIRRAQGVRRIEITVAHDDQPVKWAEKLGFKREASGEFFSRYVIDG